ncbi:MAG TPA: hypothetical protein VI298_02245 [Geobacteraceae bacterium]
MNEKMFIRPELAENHVAISIERHILRSGDTTRAFVVEQRGEREGVSRKLESDLPVLENANQERKSPPGKGIGKPLSRFPSKDPASISQSFQTAAPEVTPTGSSGGLR